MLVSNVTFYTDLTINVLSGLPLLNLTSFGKYLRDFLPPLCLQPCQHLSSLAQLLIVIVHWIPSHTKIFSYALFSSSSYHERIVYQVHSQTVWISYLVESYVNSFQWKEDGSHFNAYSDIKIKLVSVWSFCIRWFKVNLLFGAIFYKKLHDFLGVLFINFGGKFCNIRLNFSTEKIFTKVGHDIRLKGEELHQLCVFERNFEVGMWR